MNAAILYPPNEETPTLPSVFLAGSIEMGTAIDWQKDLVAALADLPITIFNPRRPDWDPSWPQTKDSPQFREQVEWELAHLGRADVIALYFAPGTKSPISLLELGLFAETGKIICCCPEGFWRKGNVDIVCERRGIKVHEHFDPFSVDVVNTLRTHYPL